MWVMIYWICASSCVSQQVQGFSTRAVCEVAAVSMIEQNSSFKSAKVNAVCVNADVNLFE